MSFRFGWAEVMEMGRLLSYVIKEVDMKWICSAWTCLIARGRLGNSAPGGPVSRPAFLVWCSLSKIPLMFEDYRTILEIFLWGNSKIHESDKYLFWMANFTLIKLLCDPVYQSIKPSGTDYFAKWVGILGQFLKFSLKSCVLTCWEFKFKAL